MSSVMVNLAAGDSPFEDGWFNFDLRHPGFSRDGLINVVADLSQSLPIKDASVSVIYTSHFLEHLDPFDQAEKFLKECRRVMARKGVLRVVVPDFRRIALVYLRDPRSFYSEYGYKKPWFDRAVSWNRRLGISVMYGHKMLYDVVSLREILEVAGFRDIVEVTQQNDGYIPDHVCQQLKRTHMSHSLVMDALNS